jgi:hypothetical protein
VTAGATTVNKTRRITRPAFPNVFSSAGSCFDWGPLSPLESKPKLARPLDPIPSSHLTEILAQDQRKFTVRNHFFSNITKRGTTLYLNSQY